MENFFSDMCDWVCGADRERESSIQTSFLQSEYIVFALHEAADVDALHDDFFCEF